MEQSMGYKSVSSGFQLKSNGSNSISTSNGNGNGNGNTDGTSNTSSSLFGSESKSGSNRPKSSTMGFVSHGGKQGSNINIYNSVKNHFISLYDKIDK